MTGRLGEQIRAFGADDDVARPVPPATAQISTFSDDRQQSGASVDDRAQGIRLINRLASWLETEAVAGSVGEVHPHTEVALGRGERGVELWRNCRCPAPGVRPKSKNSASALAYARFECGEVTASTTRRVSRSRAPPAAGTISFIRARAGVGGGARVLFGPEREQQIRNQRRNPLGLVEPDVARDAERHRQFGLVVAGLGQLL